MEAPTSDSVSRRMRPKYRKCHKNNFRHSTFAATSLINCARTFHFPVDKLHISLPTLSPFCSSFFSGRFAHFQINWLFDRLKIIIHTPYPWAMRHGINANICFYRDLISAVRSQWNHAGSCRRYTHISLTQTRNIVDSESVAKLFWNVANARAAHAGFKLFSQLKHDVAKTLECCVRTRYIFIVLKTALGAAESLAAVNLDFYTNLDVGIRRM